MGSLQEQLLKAGLVSEQKLKESRSDRRKKRRNPEARQTGEAEVDLARAYAERARVEQRDRDRELNRKREEERRRRERNAQLKQLVVPQALNDPKAELPRYFEHNGKIRKLYVTADQQQRLTDGALGIVYLRGRYFLVSAEILERARAVSEDALAFFAPLAPDPVASEDHDYSDPRYQVPDDLQW